MDIGIKRKKHGDGSRRDKLFKDNCEQRCLGLSFFATKRKVIESLFTVKNILTNFYIYIDIKTKELYHTHMNKCSYEIESED